MNTKTLNVNGRAYTERQARTMARAIVRRMYGPTYKVGQSVWVERIDYSSAPEGVLATVRQPNGRLSAFLMFKPE